MVNQRPVVFMPPCRQLDATLATNEEPERECRFESCRGFHFEVLKSMSRLEELYAQLEKTEPGSPESKTIAEKILEEVFGGVPEGKEGATVHAPGCKCGWCLMGDTKF